ncbi:MAG: hypothetical protein ACK51N_01355, partial [bacterium]
MLWPQDIDYLNALQNPATAFNDPALRQGTVEIDPLGMPKARSGNFAIVFKLETGGHAWAIRCFKRELYDREQRYAAISDHLQRLAVPYLSRFEYEAHGIRIAKAWYPILKMEWVSGDLLRPWVERHLHQPDQLRALASRFVEAAAALRRGGIGHGDLQHGNIVIVNDQPRFIDYDSMFVPALSGRDCPELGHENYQHPGRTERHFGPFMDDFSIWVIYVSLIALSFDASLWQRYSVNEEAMLFRRPDLKDPRNSNLFAELARARDPRLRVLSQSLLGLLSRPPDGLPPLGDSLALPIGEIVVACPACHQRLRVPVQAGTAAIRCPACKHEHEWVQGPAPGKQAVTGGNEWWRHDRQPQPTAPAGGSQAGPYITVDASLYQPAPATDATWVLESLAEGATIQRAGYGKCFVADRWLLFLTLLAALALLGTTLASSSTEWILARGALAAAVLATNPLLWVIRYRHHPAYARRREHQRRVDELSGRVKDIERQRAECGRIQKIRQKDISRRDAGLARELKAKQKQLARAIRADCKPIEKDIQRMKSRLLKLQSHVQRDVDRALRLIDGRLAMTRRVLADLPAQRARELALIDQREQAEVKRTEAPLTRRLESLRQSLSTAVAAEDAEAARVFQAYFKTCVEDELRRNAIGTASIPGIGTGLQQRLIDAGIRTALDVDASRIYGVSGFGPHRVSQVLAWRSGLLVRVMQSVKDLPAAERRRIADEWSAKRQRWSDELAQLEAGLAPELAQVREAYARQKAAVATTCSVRERDMLRDIAQI